MTHNPNNDELNGDDIDDVELPDDIAARLADESTWAPVPDELEASIVASVLAEIEASDLTAESPAGITAPDLAADLDPVSDADRGSSARVSSSDSTVLDKPAFDNVVAMPSRVEDRGLGAAAALLIVAGIAGATRDWFP